MKGSERKTIYGQIYDKAASFRPYFLGFVILTLKMDDPQTDSLITITLMAVKPILNPIIRN